MAGLGRREGKWEEMAARMRPCGDGETEAARWGFLHFYHYNELHSSHYHYYDATYIYTIREKFDLQIYHI